MDAYITHIPSTVFVGAALVFGGGLLLGHGLFHTVLHARPCVPEDKLPDPGLWTDKLPLGPSDEGNSDEETEIRAPGDTGSESE